MGFKNPSKTLRGSPRFPSQITECTGNGSLSFPNLKTSSALPCKRNREINKMYLFFSVKWRDPRFITREGSAGRQGE
ncbi:hypothetical protein OIU77_014677 [Salix suchowensis]|uniref:Uncharacterized protein n=1 Tax=Salix suchowensis TaxID=1278906 RepID=A0ABQ8ZYY8_9ROSI|nr:hypothetical protein OIU77_014677 [Salix suchowensis]